MLAVFRGDATHIPTAKAQSRHQREIDLRDRIAAATWLADRAFGRPGQILDDEVPEIPIGYDLSALTLDELRTLQGILGKAVPRELSTPRSLPLSTTLFPRSRGSIPPGAMARRGTPLSPS